MRFKLHKFLVAYLVAFHTVCVVNIITSEYCQSKQPTQPTQHRFVGVWEMTWGGSTVDAEFRQDGTYWCDWICGRRWEGVWTYDQTKDTLNVGETVGPFTPGTIPLSSWEVELESGSLKGKIGGVGPFELKAKAKAKTK